MASVPRLHRPQRQPQGHHIQQRERPTAKVPIYDDVSQSDRCTAIRSARDIHQVAPFGGSFLSLPWSGHQNSAATSKHAPQAFCRNAQCTTLLSRNRPAAQLSTPCAKKSKRFESWTGNCFIGPHESPQVSSGDRTDVGIARLY